MTTTDTGMTTTDITDENGYAINLLAAESHRAAQRVVAVQVVADSGSTLEIWLTPPMLYKLANRMLSVGNRYMTNGEKAALQDVREMHPCCD
jgi:hypothetical protein